MIQAVITPEHRGGLGMHYTSVPNIMRVIEPLFLNELYEEFEAAKGNKKKLIALLNRIWNIKIFDPACGSGNFLIIAYKELRKLEIAIIKEYDKVKAGNSGFAEIQSSLFPKAQLRLGDDETGILQFDSKIKLSQFYGIELDDFAHEVAILSLWLAEHQMNQVFFKEFGRTKPALPLNETGNIVHGNATRLDWKKVCPITKSDEIYVLGNPPYLGARVLDEVQKGDMQVVFDGKLNGYNDLDYISCWFYKGKEYITGNNCQFAFVSTNSISQGSQVELIWPYVISDSIEIKFAHLPFKWENNAKANAGVTCVIIGLRNTSTKPKYIFNDKFKVLAQNVNAYLVEGKNLYIKGRNKPLSNIPEIKFGSMPNDGGYLILSEEEYLMELKNDKQIQQFIKPMLGGQDFIKGIVRYCIWIEDDQIKEAQKIPFILKRINQVKTYRLASKRDATKRLAAVAHRFGKLDIQIQNL
jgi:type II restriction/modification system DNA methylase subunit YeeA